MTMFQERPPPGTPGIINAGVYLFNRGLLDALTADCSLEADILPAMARSGRLRGTLGDGYFRDIGVPDDFDRADDELRTLRGRRALFLDRDGVINIDHGHVGSHDRFEWVPGALDTIRHATAAGWHVFVVTNQSGVARGFYDEDAVRRLLAWIGDEARRHGGTIDDFRYCPFHPDARVSASPGVERLAETGAGDAARPDAAWELDPGANRDNWRSADRSRPLSAAGTDGICSGWKPVVYFLNLSENEEPDPKGRSRMPDVGNDDGTDRAGPVALRLGLAGGGTDLGPNCDEFRGAVLNFMIDRYAYDTIEPLPPNRMVHFVAPDMNTTERFAPELASIRTSKLPLHRSRRPPGCWKDRATALPRRCASPRSSTRPGGSGLGSFLGVGRGRRWRRFVSCYGADRFRIRRTSRVRMERIDTGLGRRAAGYNTRRRFA